jgi:glycine cleavage system aminomethyltransferase T
VHASARRHDHVQQSAVVPIIAATAAGALLLLRYINKPHDKAGTAVKLVVRGKANDATVTKMPFVKTTYYRPS